MKRLVALKVLRSGRVSPEERRRFQAEAEAIARLDHPNIVRIFEIGDTGRHSFAVLEYVPGGSLDRRIRITLPDPRSAAILVMGVARAVQSAHELQILHRDLKPANILLSGDADTPLEKCSPKVTDFGLAKFLDTDSGETRANTILGTPSYMPPEQAEGRADLGPAADVYALGATLYDLLTGRPPFKGTTLAETVRMVVEQEPVPPRRIQAKVPRDLETICLKCLEKQPDRRYESALELANDLQRFLEGHPLYARPTGRAEKLWRWARRKPAIAGLAVFSFLTTLTLVVGALWFTFSLAEERRHTQLAQQIAGRESAERELARTEQRAAENIEKVTRYFSLITRARERVASRHPGWTWNAVDDIRDASAIDSSARDPAALRSELVNCLAGTTVRQSSDLTAGFNPRALCFHPDGRWIALAEGRIGFSLSPLTVTLVDPRTGAAVRKLTAPGGVVGPVTDPRPDMANAIAVSPDGCWLVVGCRGGRLHRWDLRNENPEPTSWQPDPAPFGNVHECMSLEFDPEGKSLYVAMKLQENGSVSRWDVETWNRAARCALDQAYGGLLVSRQGAVYCSGPGASLHQLDPLTLALVVEFGAGRGGVQSISPDGRVLAVSRDRGITLWDLEKREPAYQLRQPGRETAIDEELTHLRFSPDGRLLVGTSEHARHAYLWDMISGERVADWLVDDGFACPGFDPSSRFLAISGSRLSRLYEVSGQQEHQSIAPQPYPIHTSCISSDATRLAAVVGTQTIAGGKSVPLIWPHQSRMAGSEVWKSTPLGISGSAVTVSFTHDGSQVAFVREGELKVVSGASPHTVIFEHLQDDLSAAAFDGHNQLWFICGPRVLARRADWTKPSFVEWVNPVFSAKITGIGSMTSIAAGHDVTSVGGGDGSLRLFGTTLEPAITALKMPKLIAVEDRTAVRSQAFSPDDTWIVAGTASGKCHLISIPAGKPIISWTAHGDAVSAAAFLTNDRIATAGSDGFIRLWHLNERQITESWSLTTGTAVTSLSVSSDGCYLSYSCQDQRGFHVWDLNAVRIRFAELGIDDSSSAMDVPLR